MINNDSTNHILDNNIKSFVNLFRSTAPYINFHSENTFVICFRGDTVQNPCFSDIINDIALLSSLGIRLVLIYGIRPQVEQSLQMYGRQSRYINGIRITDKFALSCVKAACTEVLTKIESLLSIALTNSPANNINIRTISGKFITARPIGISNQVDYYYTGKVSFVDATKIKNQLNKGYIVLISPIGYSYNGESFNLLAEELAVEVAIALHATKCIYLINNQGLLNTNGQLIRELTVLEAQHRLDEILINNQFNYQPLKSAIKACQNGVQRVHLVPQQINGSLLLELFTHDGVGTLISTNSFELLRRATINDFGGLLELIKPLEKKNILVRRSCKKLEMEINNFIVQDRDGKIIACAYLYPFINEGLAELVCLAVDNNYQRSGRGNALLVFLEHEARQLGITSIFVLTTHAIQWFQKRGFIATKLNLLPISKQALYNYQCNSKILIKQLV